MADTKISALPAAVALTGTEILPVVQSAATAGATIAQVATYIAGSLSSSVLVNAQTGTTYTYVTGDKSKLVSHTNAATIAATLPAPGVSFPSGWFMYVENRGAGTLTITPTASTVDGAATLALTTNQGCLIASDGASYFTMRGVAAAGGAGTVTHTVGALTANALVVGNGAADTDVLASLGTTTTVLHGNAAGRPTYGTVALAADVSGLLPVANGGTGTGTPALVSGTNVTITGTWPNQTVNAAAGGGGGLANITETLVTAAPNATVNVEQLAVTGGTTNTDLALQPKGTGALQLGPAADNTATGGNKRGAQAIDLQISRSINTSVAAGAKDTIGGGQNNSTSTAGLNAIFSGDGNAISSAGTRNFIGGGQSNTIGPSNVTNSTIPGGYTNTITPYYYSSANYAYAGGAFAKAQADYAYAHGYTVTANGLNSHVRGYQATDRNITGVDVWSSVNRVAQGDNQTIRGVPLATTSDAATSTVLFLDTNAASAQNQIRMPTASVLKVKGQVVGRNNTNGEAVGFDFSVLLKNVSGTVSVVGSASVTQVFSDATMTGTTLTVGVDTTNKTLKMAVTGVAATSVFWSGEFTALQGA